MYYIETFRWLPHFWWIFRLKLDIPKETQALSILYICAKTAVQLRITSFVKIIYDSPPLFLVPHTQPWHQPLILSRIIKSKRKRNSDSFTKFWPGTSDMKWAMCLLWPLRIHLLPQSKPNYYAPKLEAWKNGKCSSWDQWMFHEFFKAMQLRSSLVRMHRFKTCDSLEWQK